MNKLRRVMLPIVLCLLICGLSFLTSYAAGQVVTQEVRVWAKTTLKNEKKLSSVLANNSLAILYFFNRTGRSDLNSLQKGMTLMLLTDLSQIKDLQLLERVKLQALAEELKLGSSGLVDQQTAPRVGKLVGVRWIAGGEYVPGQGKNFVTQSRLLDVATSEISGQFSKEGTLEDILTTEKELVLSIVDKLHISLKPEVEAAIRIPCSTSLKALDALFRGVDASDHGDYKQAGELYDEALQADPNVCVAAGAVQELKQKGLYSGPAGDTIDLQSALAETAFSVSSQTSLTNALLPKDLIRQEHTNIVPLVTTPVSIRINFP